MKTRKYILFIGLVFVLFGCATEQSSWKKAIKVNSQDSYDHYLSEYPKGEYSEIASGKIEKLKFEKAAKLESTNAIAASYEYKKYINEYPNGMYIEKAKKGYELTLAETVILLKSLDELNNYIQTYPKTTRRNEIEQLISELQKKKELAKNEANRKLFFAASLIGDLETAKQLIISGVDVNCIDASSRSALIITIMNNTKITFGLSMTDFHVTGEIVEGLPAAPLSAKQEEMIKFLLTKGALTKTEEYSALILAVERDYSSIIKKLIEAGASVNEKLSSGASIAQLAYVLGHIKTLKILVQEGAYIKPKMINADFIDGGDKIGYNEAREYLLSISPK